MSVSFFSLIEFVCENQPVGYGDRVRPPPGRVGECHGAHAMMRRYPMTNESAAKYAKENPPRSNRAGVRNSVLLTWKSHRTLERHSNRTGIKPVETIGSDRGLFRNRIQRVPVNSTERPRRTWKSHRCHHGMRDTVPRAGFLRTPRRSKLANRPVVNGHLSPAFFRPPGACQGQLFDLIFHAQIVDPRLRGDEGWKWTWQTSPPDQLVDPMHEWSRHLD